jgi:hypothetical protein
MVGTDLDYSKIQNLLVGEARRFKGKYTESLVEQLYRLDDAVLTKENILHQCRLIYSKQTRSHKLLSLE